METLEKIYCLRLALGIVAAFVCAGYGIAAGVISNKEFPLNTFFNSLSIALIVYIISYYIIKRKFLPKVEKPQKLASTGIGIYFIVWLVFWVLLYTIIAGPPPPV
jgi:glucan phosphoethanolaminetransferase (alkaline phosphatase superfamily)